MIWLALTALAAIALAPLAWSLWGDTLVRSRRDAALALHRAQLDELDRDLAAARIAAPEHATARLEIQRRLLAEAATTETAARTTRLPLVATLVFVPVAAFLLYLPGSAPNLPAAPLAGRRAEAAAQAADAQALIDELKAKIATLNPQSEQAREGHMLLGNAEDTRGNLAGAADAWAQALAVRFDPTLAAEVAEAHSRVEGRVSPQSADLFRRALAAAPPDAPWRTVVEQRLASLASPPVPR